MNELMRVEDLRVHFRTRAGVLRAVDGVDLTLDEGRTLGVVGESGSGKSATALAIMRLVEPPGRIEDGSRITLGEHDLTAANRRQLRRIRGNEVSMIFQEPMTSLNPLQTVGTQIVEAIRLHEKVTGGEARKRALAMLELVGVASPANRLDDYPHQMSGGMRQRVMIAMALACEPRLLIADEPTTALDVTIQAQILELLRDLRSRLGMAIMLITHDFGVVAEMCDDVAVMYAGKVVERGPVDDVLRRPRHPYTVALLRSIPTLGMTYAEPLYTIPGSVGSPLVRTRGCRFANRCDHTFDRCTREAPTLLPVPGTGRAAACWLGTDARTEEAPA